MEAFRRLPVFPTAHAESGRATIPHVRGQGVSEALSRYGVSAGVVVPTPNPIPGSGKWGEILLVHRSCSRTISGIAARRCPSKDLQCPNQPLACSRRYGQSARIGGPHGTLPETGGIPRKRRDTPLPYPLPERMDPRSFLRRDGRRTFLSFTDCLHGKTKRRPTWDRGSGRWSDRNGCARHSGGTSANGIGR